MPKILRTLFPAVALIGLAACQPAAEETLAPVEHISLSVDANGKLSGTKNGTPLTEAELEALTQAGKAPLDPGRAVKVALYRDGRIEVDGVPTEAEQFGDKMKTAAAGKKYVVYYREEAEYGLSPQQKGAMPAILGAVAENLLPIRFSLNPDFSDAVIDTGNSPKP